MIKMRIEDWLAVGSVVGFAIVFIVVAYLAIAGTDKISDIVVVRDPIDHNMMLVIQEPEKAWSFKHCTTTNTDCGRFE